MRTAFVFVDKKVVYRRHQYHHGERLADLYYSSNQWFIHDVLSDINPISDNSYIEFRMGVFGLRGKHWRLEEFDHTGYWACISSYKDDEFQYVDSIVHRDYEEFFGLLESALASYSTSDFRPLSVDELKFEFAEIKLTDPWISR